MIVPVLEVIAGAIPIVLLALTIMIRPHACSRRPSG